MSGIYDNLKAYYKWDSDYSDSVANYDLINQGGSLASGKIGDSYEVSGTSSNYDKYAYGSNPLTLGTTDFSVNFWYKRTSNNGSIYWIRFGDTTYSNVFDLYCISSDSYKIRVNLYNSGVDYYDVATESFDISESFNMITFVRVGTSVSIYKNGVLVDTLSHGQWTNIPAFSNMRINMSYAQTTNVDELSLFDKALTSSEIKQLYNFGIGNAYPFNASNMVKQYSDLFGGLVAGYDFKGDAKDFSGNGYDGTVSGASLTSNHFGVPNSAYSFNGTSDYIKSVPASNFPTSFTVSVWAKHLTSNVYNTMMGIDKTESGPIGLLYLQKAVDNRWKCIVVNTDDTQFMAESDATYTDTNWHHIVGTYDDSSKSVKLYVDGILQSTSPTLTGTRATPNDYMEIGAGWYSDAITDFFNGSIAFPLLFDKELSADEVKRLYNLTKSKFIYPFPQFRQGGLLE